MPPFFVHLALQVLLREPVRRTLAPHPSVRISPLALIVVASSPLRVALPRDLHDSISRSSTIAKTAHCAWYAPTLPRLRNESNLFRTAPPRSATLRQPLPVLPHRRRRTATRSRAPEAPAPPGYLMNSQPEVPDLVLERLVGPRLYAYELPEQCASANISRTRAPPAARSAPGRIDLSSSRMSACRHDPLQLRSPAKSSRGPPARQSVGQCARASVIRLELQRHSQALRLYPRPAKLSTALVLVCVPSEASPYPAFKLAVRRSFRAYTIYAPSRPLVTHTSADEPIALRTFRQTLAGR